MISSRHDKPRELDFDRMRWGVMLELIVIFCFLSALLLLYQIVNYISNGRKSIDRLKKYTNIEDEHEEKRKESRKEFKLGLNIIAKGVGSARFLDGYKKNIQLQLTRAHILLKAEEFIALNMIICVLLVIISLIITKSMELSNVVIFTLALGITGWLLPSIILKSKIKKRLKHLNEQLCDAIVLISNSLKAGCGFFQAIDAVSKEMTGPIAEEFAYMQKEINLGSATEKALENLVSRVQSDDLELVVTAVLIQRQIGGNLSEVLDNISSTIRERVKIKGEIKTLTAQGKLSGLIIAVLPVALGLITFVISPENMMPLFTNPIGILIVVFSIMMELIGIYFIKKIVKIEI